MFTLKNIYLELFKQFSSLVFFSVLQIWHGVDGKSWKEAEKIRRAGKGGEEGENEVEQRRENLPNLSGVAYG